VTGDHLLGLVLVNLLFLAAGLGVTGASGWWRGVAGLRGALGLSYLAGVAAFGITAQLLYVCGAAMVVWQVVLVCAVFALATIRALRRPAGEMVLQRSRQPFRFAALGIVLMAALIGVDLWYQPLWAYDSWTFWTPKAHALWALHGLDAGWFTQADLTSRDYPILLPSVEAAGFHVTGYETSLLDIQSLFFAVAFLRAIYEACAGRARSALLWAPLAMLVVAPSLTDQLAAAEADVPVAALFGASGLAAALWLRERHRGSLCVAAVLAAGASATKVEGLVFTAALFITLAAVARAATPLLAGVAAVVAGVLPWRVWLELHHIPNQGSYSRLGAGYLANHVARVPESAAYLLVKMLDPRAWLLLVPLFLFVLWRAWLERRSPLPAFAAGTFVLAFGGLVLAYWSTRLGLHYQLTTSARRVVTGIVFFGAALTPLLAEAA